MKLWYQSMSRQTEWGGYPRVLRGILDKVRDPDTEIHVAGITEIGGVGDQFRYLEYLETGEVLKNVHRAVREGFDAFLIGNIAATATDATSLLELRHWLAGRFNWHPSQ